MYVVLTEIIHPSSILWPAVNHLFYQHKATTQPAITCSKLTIETLEQGVKYAQS